MKLTQEQYDTLKDYILNGAQKDDFAPFILIGNDAKITEMLNSEKEKVEALVGKADIHAALHQFAHSSNLPVWWVINKVSIDTTDTYPEGLKASCFMILQSATASYTNLDFSLNKLQEILAALVAGGILTSEQLTILQNMAQKSLSYAESVLNLSPQTLTLDVNDISYILRGKK